VEAFDVAAEDGREEGADCGADVDAKVEEGKELGEVVLLGGEELVATEGADAGLDAACAEADHDEADGGTDQARGT